MGRFKNAIPSSPPAPSVYISLGRRSSMKERELGRIQSCFQIPIDHHLKLPTPEETSTPLVGGRGFGVYLASLRAGFRFPLCSFGMEWLDYDYIVPTQIHPNDWAQLVCNIPHRAIRRTETTYSDGPTRTSQGGHPSLGFPKSSTLNMGVPCLHSAQKVSSWCCFLSSISSIYTTLIWALGVLHSPPLST